MSGGVEILLVEDNPNDVQLTLHVFKKNHLCNHIHVVRDGAEKKVSVKLDEADAEKIARDGGRAETDGADDKTALGVSVAPLTPELAERFKAPKDAHGLLVQDVNPDGRAASAGIQEGDIIQSVNRQPVKTVEDLRSALKGSINKPLLVLINRQGSNVFVTVRPSNG